jgi:hypothetical protein
MGKWLKDHEQRQLEKLRKEQLERERQIQEIRKVEAERQAVVDAIETKYSNEIALYNLACERRGANTEAFIRLMLLCHEVDIRKFTPQEHASLIESYNLTPFARWLNELCPKIAPPKKGDIPTFEED